MPHSADHTITMQTLAKATTRGVRTRRATTTTSDGTGVLLESLLRTGVSTHARNCIGVGPINSTPAVLESLSSYKLWI